jgi:hypothetical protein
MNSARALLKFEQQKQVFAKKKLGEYLNRDGISFP